MTFCYLDKSEKDSLLPELFALFYDNMHDIAPISGSFQQEQDSWIAELSPALDKAPRQVVLCLADGKLAGYVQYYIRGSMLMVEELQVRKEYQRTCLFYRFCKYLLSVLPRDLQTVEAYAHQGNHASIRMMQRLGMCICEENPTFVHLRGPAEAIYRFFRRT